MKRPPGPEIQNAGARSGGAPQRTLLILTGMILVVVVLALLVAAQGISRATNATLRRHQQAYLQIATLLACPAEPEEEAALAGIARRWAALPHQPDAYVCVVNAEGRILLHSAHPQTVGADASCNPVAQDPAGPTSLGEIVRRRIAYVGEYRSTGGEAQVAAFAPVDRWGWCVGVHRARAAVDREIGSDLGHASASLAVLTFLLIPGCIFLVFRLVRREQRARLQHERSRAHLERALVTAREREVLVRINGKLAHHTNNALMAILGQAELLLHDGSRAPSAPGDLRAGLESIGAAARRLERVTRALSVAIVSTSIDLRETQSGGDGPVMTEIDGLRLVVLEAIGDLMPTGVHLRWPAEPRNLQVPAPAEVLGELLVSLILLASRERGPGREVLIRHGEGPQSTPEAGSAFLTIRGAGFQGEEWGEPWLLESTVSFPEHDEGLGLASARKLAVAMHATLTAATSIEGQDPGVTLRFG